MVFEGLHGCLVCVCCPYLCCLTVIPNTAEAAPKEFVFENVEILSCTGLRSISIFLYTILLSITICIVEFIRLSDSSIEKMLDKYHSAIFFLIMN